jgi:HYR domain
MGETTVTCTATDSAGNTASATFRVTVLRPLDIRVQLDRSGSVNPSTRVATGRGTVSCNRPVSIFLNGELQQTIAGRMVTSGFSMQADCAPPASAWTAKVTAANARYSGGPAAASVAASACDQLSSVRL